MTFWVEFSKNVNELNVGFFLIQFVKDYTNMSKSNWSYSKKITGLYNDI